MIPVEKRFPKKYQEAGLALEVYLDRLFKLQDGWSTQVYAWMETKDGFRISEVSLTNGTSGSSWQRNLCGVIADGFILACEQFVLTYHIPPERPQGWTEDLDLHLEAKELVKAVVEEHLSEKPKKRKARTR